MNISSILITIVGIIIILALYLLSRISQSKLPKNQVTLLPDIKDEGGEKFTSVLDDIPATDGSTPIISKSLKDNEVSKEKPSTNTNKQQLVLFISAKNEETLEGNTIKQALIDNGLSLGDNNIYHFQVENDQQQSASLFRVANGIEPWTLKDQDLLDQQLAGLSMVMMLPNIINSKEAFAIYLEKAEIITEQVNGLLKNQQQQILSDEDKVAFITNL